MCQADPKRDEILAELQSAVHQCQQALREVERRLLQLTQSNSNRTEITLTSLTPTPRRTE